MFYSNYICYQCYYIVLNTKSQRCREYIRRSSKYDILQVSINDLWDLRLEKENLKFEKDTAFEVAIVGLARVHELELRQQELHKRGMEMLHCGLKSLDELNIAKEKEHLAAEHTQPKREASVSAGSAVDSPINSDLVEALAAYDPSNPY